MVSEADHDLPWTGLPSTLAPLLSAHLPVITEQLLAGVHHDVPVYAAPLGGALRQEIRHGVQAALTRFLDLADTDQPALREVDRVVYEGLGRAEVHQGRPMDALFTAYRSGARTTLRSMSKVAMEAGFEASVLIVLAESVFAYIEELSAASAQGYAAEQSERAGERDRLLDMVAEMLIRGHAEEDAVRAAVLAAGWILPERVVVVVLPAGRRPGLRSRLGPGAVLTSRPGDVVAVLPEPPTSAARRELGRSLTGRAAVVGPGRPWQAASDSLRLAVAARDLLEHDGEDPLWVRQHLTRLLLHSDRALLEDLATQRLAPLEHLRPAQQQRLVTTLLSWLKHHGQRAVMAAELDIHEQTVGYRINQLREIFGEALHDPQARFELELVLRARADQNPA